MTASKQQELIYGLQNIKARHHGCVLTVGSFDGVHLGHQTVLRQVIGKAKSLGLPSVVMIFEPQPMEYFKPEKAPARLMRFREKVRALFAAGVDRVCCLRFNETLSKLSAEEFVQQLIVDKLGVRHLVIGDDFRFGQSRSGDFDFLQECGQRMGFKVSNTHTFTMDDERVSSTRIRQELAAGDFELAKKLLGKPYEITGHVVYGKQLGRQLGVPTANVELKRFRSPVIGVFAVRARLAGHDGLLGVANIGVRPTIEASNRVLLEVHLLDFGQNIYGKMLTVEFCQKIRDEKRFDSLDELKAQINIDISQAQSYFATGAPI